MEELIITRELIAHYRDASGLRSRPWIDMAVQGYTIALSRRLTIACGAGFDRTVTDIMALFVLCEPLHEHSEQDYEGTLLWVAYQLHCMQDLVGVQAAIVAGLQRFPGDERLRRLEREIADLGKKKTSRPH